MEEKMFNLLEEPWICVIDKECNIRELSILKLFEHAHEYMDLRGELATQDIAILRLLLAVLHTVFSRYDLDGREARLKDTDDALDRWEALWETGKFPMEPIRTYLESQREKFWLFHPERPFYQCSKMANLKVRNGEYTTKKLIGTLAESDNKKRIFSLISENKRKSIAYPEAARWLIHICNFDDTACKSGTGLGWLGQLGLVYIIGDNLYETLLLNLILSDEKDQIYGSERPIWERHCILTDEKKNIVFPDNLSELYTMPSRKVYLTHSDNYVNGYKISGGEYFDSKNAFCEPMTLWKRKNSKVDEAYFPHKHEDSKQFWREFPSIISKIDCNYKQPGIIRWVSTLEETGLLKEDYRLKLKIVAMDYDSKHMSIANVFYDSISLYVNLISELDKEWKEMLINQVAFCDKLASYAWKLACDVNLSAGGNNDTSKVAANHLKEKFYLQIDEPFRKWLCELNPQTDDAVLKAKEWNLQCVKIAENLGKEMISEIASPAIFGRNGVSAAGAINKFMSKLKKAAQL